MTWTDLVPGNNDGEYAADKSTLLASVLQQDSIREELVYAITICTQRTHIAVASGCVTVQSESVGRMRCRGW